VFARNFYLLALAVSTACATAGTGAAPASRNANVISEPEIAASHESNAYEVIRTLRPLYLKSRGKSSINGSGSDFASVYLDGQPYGDLSTLRNIVSSQIREIRYYSSTDAMTRFGMQAAGGAIDIHTK
jgi:outer membrane receptor for ferrienterochelin and colicin